MSGGMCSRIRAPSVARHAANERAPLLVPRGGEHLVSQVRGGPTFGSYPESLSFHRRTWRRVVVHAGPSAGPASKNADPLASRLVIP